MLTIDLDADIQILYFNVYNSDGIKLGFRNKFNNEKFDLIISDYCTKSNTRFSRYEIPTDVFSPLDTGTYQFLIRTIEDKVILSGICHVVDDYSSNGDQLQLENLKEVDNRKQDEAKPTTNINDWL